MIPKQQAFDTVVAHLRRQGRKSMDHDGNCLYRGPDGLMCAAGCLIPDDLYDPRFEGQTLETDSNLWSVRSPSRCLWTLGYDLFLLRALQRVHDMIPQERWEYHFERIAEEHQVVYTPDGRLAHDTDVATG